MIGDTMASNPRRVLPPCFPESILQAHSPGRIQ